MADDGGAPRRVSALAAALIAATGLLAACAAPFPGAMEGTVLETGTRLSVDFDPDAPVEATDPPIVVGLNLTASCPPPP